MVGERVAHRGALVMRAALSRSRGPDEPEASGHNGEPLSPDYGDLCSASAADLEEVESERLYLSQDVPGLDAECRRPLLWA